MASTNSTLPANKWAVFGFTTTPEERIGPPPPYSSPALQINLFFRVFLGILSIFLTFVPARLLWRNGEFGGTVICVMLIVNNLITIVNALIWRDDNVQDWWAGYGWCDFLTYAFFALHTAFNISLFEIMRGLASKVALNRAVRPTRSERRRQHIISALVIFTVPAIQVILTYWTTISRYNISTLAGCSAVYYPNWIYLVFYILPTPVFAVLAAYAAGLTFYRYRKIDQVTRDISRSQGSMAAVRQQQVRKKLYLMTLVCIIIVLPLILVLLTLNIIEGAPWNLPYNFDALHYGPDPFNVRFISFTTSDKMNFTSLNIAYISEVGSFLVFITFGTTPEALNMFREQLLFLRLGYIFPKLREEYVPSPKRRSPWRNWGPFARPLHVRSLLGTNSSTSTRKGSLLPTAEQVSLASRADRSSLAHSQRKDSMFSNTDTLPYPEKAMASSSAHQNPWPDLSADEQDATTAQLDAGPRPPARNPYAVLPSTHARPSPKFPSLSIPMLHRHKQPHPQPQQPSTTLVTHLEAPTPTSTSTSTSPLTSPQTQLRTTPTTTTTTLPLPLPLSPRPPPTTPAAEATPWSPTPTSHPTARVDTRVWASSPSPPSPSPNNKDNTTTAPNNTDHLESGITSTGQPAVVERGVRVETSIARRSVELDLDFLGLGLGLDRGDNGGDNYTSSTTTAAS